jgi:hypothetical protein
MPSPVSSTSGLETPSGVESSSIENDVQTPKVSRTPTSHTGPEAVTPTMSGATTPTTAALSDESRKAKSFLGFVPLTDFIRARYPSTSQSSDKTLSRSHSTTESVHAEDFEAETNLGGTEADEVDRMSIHADNGP